jgi:hypothetical protein
MHTIRKFSLSLAGINILFLLVMALTARHF